MSFLFHKKTKQAIGWIWGIIAIIIIFSMVLAYSGGTAGLFSPQASVTPTSTETIPTASVDSSSTTIDLVGSSTASSTITVPVTVSSNGATPKVDFGPNAIP